MVGFRNLDSLIEDLDRILAIFKKNPNRKFKSEYLLNKTTLKNNLVTNFNEEILKFTSPEDKPEIEVRVAKFKKILASLNTILSTLSEEISHNSSLFDDSEDIFETLNMDFDLKSHVNIIPEFDGQLSKYSNFINFVEFVHDTLNDNGKSRLITFILKTKLSDSIRLKLSAYPSATTLAQFKEQMSKILKSNKTSLSIQSELSRTRQNNASVIDFSSKIESLVAELNSMQISQRGEQYRDIIIQMNDEIALNAFKTGISDRIKPTIIAGRPSSLNEAINLALDSETPQQEAKIFAFRSKHSKNFKKTNGFNKGNYEKPKSKFCKYCKKKGHEISECFKKKKVDNKSNRNPENYQVPESHNSGSSRNQ